MKICFDHAIPVQPSFSPVSGSIIVSIAVSTTIYLRFFRLSVLLVPFSYECLCVHYVVLGRPSKASGDVDLSLSQ
jgi:hypothetical protein